MSFTSLFFSFRGRINRSMFWVGLLAIIGAGFAGYHVFDFAFNKITTQYGIDQQLVDIIARSIPLAAIAAAGIAIWTLLVKRLHDRSKSAWVLLIFAGLTAAAASWLGYYDISWLPRPDLPEQAFQGIGIFGGLGVLWLVIEILIIPSHAGANRYGPDPLQIAH